MAALLRNVHDRTHYVRMIDLEQPERLSEIMRMIHAAASAVETRDISSAVWSLEQNFNVIMERIPALVKEGVGRACTLASSRPLWSNGEIGQGTSANASKIAGTPTTARSSATTHTICGNRR